jgi:hypothetical protein
MVIPYMVSRLFKFTHHTAVSNELLQPASSAATAPRMISEAVRKAIGKK